MLQIKIDKILKELGENIKLARLRRKLIIGLYKKN